MLKTYYAFVKDNIQDNIQHTVRLPKTNPSTTLQNNTIDENQNGTIITIYQRF